MGLYHFALLVVVALLASADLALAQMRVPTTETHALGNYTSTKRLLRTFTAINEERGISEKILSAFKSSTTKELRVERKEAAALLSSANFKDWSNQAAKINPENPQGALYTILKDVIGERNVATMILLGKQTRSSKSAAKKLEAGQFNAWLSQKKTPDDVVKDILGIDPHISKKYPRASEVAQDYGKFRLNKIFG